MRGRPLATLEQRTDERRACPNCGAVLVRPRYFNGQLQTTGQWLARRFCDRTCMGAYYRGKPRGNRL